jgi:hypothetical protein
LATRGPRPNCVGANAVITEWVVTEKPKTGRRGEAWRRNLQSRVVNAEDCLVAGLGT